MREERGAGSVRPHEREECFGVERECCVVDPLRRGRSVGVGNKRGGEGGGGKGEGTYDSGVADEVIEPGGPEDGRELRRERADVVEVGDVELHDVQRALGALLEVRECGRFGGGAAGGDDEVGGGGEELADELEADAAVCTGVARLVGDEDARRLRNMRTR